MSNASRDDNRVPTLLGVSSLDMLTPVRIAANPTTGALLIDGTSLYATLDTKYLELDGTNQTSWTPTSTLVSNLNADLWDGYQFADYLNQAVKTTSSPTFLAATIGSASSAGTITIPAVATGHGPFVLNSGVNVFAGTDDPTLFLGYNLTYGATRITAGQAGIAIGFEADYNDGSRRLAEFYCHMVATGVSSTYYRPFAFTIDRDSPTSYAVGQVMISGTSGQFVVLRGSDDTALLKVLSAGSGTTITSGELIVGSNLNILNTSNITYQTGAYGTTRYQMGFSGAGGFQFQSLDSGTPRSFYIVSSGGASKFVCEFETGNTQASGTFIAGSTISSSAGNLNIAGTGDSYIAGALSVGTTATAGAAKVRIYGGYLNVGASGADGTYAEVIRLSINSLPTQYYHQIFSTASGGGITLNKIKFSLCDNTAAGHVDVLTLSANERVGIGSNAIVPGATVHDWGTTTTTNAPLEVLRLQASVSTASTGFANGGGAAMTMYGETATDGTHQQMAQMSSIWTDSTNASRKAYLTLSAYDTAQREGLRISADGSKAVVTIADENGSLASISSNPGAAAKILQTNTSGYLQLTRLGIGGAPTYYPLYVNGASVFIGSMETFSSYVQQYSNAATTHYLWTWSDTYYVYPYFSMYKARGTSASPADVQGGDYCGAINYYGRYGGTPAVGVATMSSRVDTIDTTYLKGIFTFSVGDGSSGGANYTVFEASTKGLAVPNGTAFTPSSLLHLKMNDAITNTLTTIFRIDHNTTGTAANGFGSSLDWYLESSTTADQSASQIAVLWTDATHATRTSNMVFKLVNSAAAIAEVGRWKPTSLVIGSGVAGTDYALSFDGETNDGVITWMEDEDYFQLGDDIFIGTEKCYFNGTDTSIYESGDDVHIDTPANKTLVLDESVFNDANIGSLVLVTGGTLPGVVEILESDGGASGIYSRGFAVNEQGSGSIEIPHDYKEGTNLVFHVHWVGQDAPTGTDNVRWQLTYSVAREGVVTPAVTTVVAADDTAFDTQYKWMMTNVATITGTNFKIGDQFNFTLTRIAATGDAYAGEAVVGTLGFHYESDTIGSRQITAK